VSKKITDKERLDWMNARLLSSCFREEGIGVTPNCGMTFTSASIWPNKSLRRTIDAAIKASRGGERR